MAGKRVPGPACVSKGHGPSDHRMRCQQPTPAPGPLGVVSHWATEIEEDAGRLWDWTGDKTRSVGRSIWGHSKSLLISILDLIPLKPDSPYSTTLLKHYVEASGDPYEMKDVPKDWQDWIVKATKGQPGTHKALNPYNSGLYDLRNSLGHFDVTVRINKDKTKTYEIHKDYHFGYQKHDKWQQGRHGFPLGHLDKTTIKLIKHLLPSGEYQNPGGFKERWEIKTVGKETFLFIPQQYLEEQGKPFEVKGSFTR